MPASASRRAAAASARCAFRSRASSTARISPRWTTRFLIKSIFVICALTFGEIVASCRPVIVPTMSSGCAIGPTSAFANRTLTTGASASSSPAALWRCQHQPATMRIKRPTPAPICTRRRRQNGASSEPGPCISVELILLRPPEGGHGPFRNRTAPADSWFVAAPASSARR